MDEFERIIAANFTVGEATYFEKRLRWWDRDEMSEVMDDIYSVYLMGGPKIDPGAEADAWLDGLTAILGIEPNTDTEQDAFSMTPLPEPTTAPPPSRWRRFWLWIGGT